MKKVAVVTMAYNEKSKLPIWLEFYSRQVGVDHCYVVDHGSDDGSTKDLRGANRIFLPRSPQDNNKRLKFIEALADSLLMYYDAFVYVDADELLVANPNKYENLTDYVNKTNSSVVTSIGLEVCHRISEEGPLNSDARVGTQRSYVLFSSSMCKANLIRRKVVWSPGWHSYDGEVNFDDLYLFHLRHADLEQTLARLRITREMAWASENAGRHQRTSDNEMESLVRSFGSHRVCEVDDFLAPGSPLNRYLDQFKKDTTVREAGKPAIVPLAVYGSELIRIPDAFKAEL